MDLISSIVSSYALPFLPNGLKHMNWEAIAYAPTKYSFWMLGTPYFSHFLDQCVRHYPSPLEDDAGIASILILLFVAGSIEFMYCSALAEVSSGFIWTVSLLVKLYVGFGDPMSSIGLPIRNIVFALSLFNRFMSRWPRFLQAIRRKCPQAGARNAPTLSTLCATFIQFNPALVILALTACVAKVCTGSLTMRVGVLRLFFMLMAPFMEYEGFFAIMKGESQQYFQDYSKTLTDWRTFLSLALDSMAVIALEMIISRLPLALIKLTQYAQSRDRVVALTLDERTATQWNKVVSTRRKLQQVVQTRFDFIWSWSAPIFLSWCRQKPPANVSAGNLHISEVDIKPTSIKLLSIKPGLAHQPLDCTLTWTDLDDLSSTPYTAISYAWKSPTLQHRIIVNNQSIQVTKSAHEVLQAMRSCLHYRTIWLDALCIDQSPESTDKQRQIPLMPLIYERATQVLVWLGKSPDAALAIGTVQRLFLSQKLMRLANATTSLRISNEAAQALGQMMAQSWFRRAWVVQEVVRGHGKVSVRYGDDEVSWGVFSWFAQALRRNDKLLSIINSDISDIKISDTTLRNIEVINHFTEVTSTTAPLSLLFHLVQMFRSQCVFDSERKQDRIYALLGLSGSDTSNSIQVDYDKCDKQLYIDVAYHLAATSQEDSRLDFLTHAGRGYESTIVGLPSWAPDWSLKPKTMPIVGTEGSFELLHSKHIDKLVSHAAWFNADGQYQFVPGEPTKHEVAVHNATLVKDAMIASLFNASKGLTPSFSFDDDILIVQGQIVDRIHTVGPECPTIGPLDLRAWLKIMSIWASYVVNQPQLVDLDVDKCAVNFLRTTSCDCGESEIDLTFSTVTRVSSEIGALELNAARAIFIALIQAVDDLYTGIQSDPQWTEAFRKMMINWNITCSGRIFAITENGHMGLFLPTTHPGDLVVIVHGVRVPLTTRCTNQTAGAEGIDQEVVELIGQAYIHGIMDGSAVNSAPTKTIHIV